MIVAVLSVPFISSVFAGLFFQFPSIILLFFKLFARCVFIYLQLFARCVFIYLQLFSKIRDLYCMFDKMVHKPQSLSIVFHHAIVTNDRDIGFFEGCLRASTIRATSNDGSLPPVSSTKTGPSSVLGRADWSLCSTRSPPGQLCAVLAYIFGSMPLRTTSNDSIDKSVVSSDLA